MKKIKLITEVLLVFLMLSGCSLHNGLTGPSIERMGNWSFQENEGTEEHVLFFALKDKNDMEIAADVNVKIRIVNDAEETVYEGEKIVTESDFANYSSKMQGEHYLAAVRIPTSEIKEGKSANGTVYFTVYQNNTLAFDETNCEAYFCLPTLSYQIIAEQLPVELDCFNYNGSVQSKLKISDIEVETADYFMPTVSVTILGEKTYEQKLQFESEFDIFSYKLFDSEGYVVDSGTVYLDDLELGDKFREELHISYDLIPGETYTIKFSSEN